MNKEPRKLDPLTACFVPCCKNNVLMCPNKHFFHVPQATRKQWCSAVNKPNVPRSAVYICEDHLNLKNDLLNYNDWMSNKVKLPRLKPAVPSNIKKINKDPENVPQILCNENLADNPVAAVHLATSDKAVLCMPEYKNSSVQLEEDLKNYVKFKKHGATPVLKQTAKLRNPNTIETINKETSLNNSDSSLIKEPSKAVVEDKIDDKSEKQCNAKQLEPINEEKSCTLLKLLTSNEQIARNRNNQKLPNPMEECLKAVQEDEIDIGETIKIEDVESISSVISIKSDEGASVCRTCLTWEALVPLWSSCELDAENVTLGSLLEEVVGVTVEDGQTQLLCKDCSHALQAAAAFRRKAIRSDQTLRLKQEVNTDPQQTQYTDVLSELGKPNKHGSESPKDHIKFTLDKLSDKSRSCSPQLECGGEKLTPQPETDSDNFTWPEEEPLCDWLRERSKIRVMKRNRDSVCSSQSESDQSKSSNLKQKDKDRSWSPQLSSEEEHSSGSSDKPAKKKRQNNYKPKEQVNKRGFGIETKRKRKKNREKNLQCIECGWMTHVMSRLELHMLSHTGERPYQCSECGKGLTTKINLKQHLQTHKPETERARNFICDICGRGYYCKSNILNHMVKHLDTRFVCPSCGHAFAWKHNLKAHLKRVHQIT